MDIPKQYTDIEHRVASAILERKDVALEIEGKEYPIAPPSIATLIIISEIVAKLPIVDRTKVTKEEVVANVLHNAKDYKALGDIAAVLILGAKEVENERLSRWQRIMRRLHFRASTKRERLSKAILYNVRPTVLFDVIIRRLQDMEISTFFAITTSLSEANILRPTREVEEKKKP